jgi:DNA primase
VAGRIPQHFIDELIARADIVEVIGARVALKKAGREYKANCPFHDEKTPSFTVSPDKQFFHCFGCGAHGTALGFLMDYDHANFVEAVEELAGIVGLDVPREDEGPEQRRSEGLFDLTERASAFFFDQLKSHDRAKNYLQQRGVSGETARDYRIGFAPDAWDSLLKKFGVDAEARQRLLDTGLITRRDDGREYDRFRDRIVFPIRDARGRTVGFGGRVLDKGEPKYLNSPETALFHKGKELYGLYEARRALRKIDSLVVVEGYMDVVALAEHGIQYAVATLGTATTPDHLKRLFRICGEIVFCFDGDKAGRKAAWRALENALGELREGRQIRFLFLPEGEDPDSIVRREGAEAFAKRLADAMPLSDFMLQALAAKTNLDSVDGRARLGELARPLLERIPAGIYKELLVDSLADAVGLPSERLAALLQDRKPPAPRRPARASAPSPPRSSLLRRAITLLLHHPAAAAALTRDEELHSLDIRGIPVFLELLEDCRNAPIKTTASVLERWRGRSEMEALSRLAAQESLVTDDAAALELQDTVARMLEDARPRRRTAKLLEKAADGTISDEEKVELQSLLKRRVDASQPGTN